MAALISFVLMDCVLFIPPVSYMFGLMMLSPQLYGIGLLLAFVSMVILEIVKALGWIAK